MQVVLILGGLFLVYELVRSQEASLANQVAGLQAKVNPTGGVYTGLAAPGTSIVNTNGYSLAAQATGTGLQAAGQFAANAGGAVASVAGAAIPIIGSLVAPIFSLLAAHSARVKGATNENTALNEIIPAVTADVKGINQAYNAGQISASQAIAALQQVYGNYWSYMSQYSGKPGVAGGASNCAPCNSSNSGTACNKACTAGCCHGCNYTKCNIEASIAAIQKGGTVTVNYPGEGDLVNTSGKFGGGVFNSYSLTWKAPAVQNAGILSGLFS